MNKKLTSLLRPNMILYFAVLLLMFVPLAVTGQYLFAAIELAVALLVMGIYQWDAHRRRRALAKFISENDELLRRAKDGDLPFPILIVRLSDGALAWYNKRFSKLTGVRDTLRPQSVAEVLPGLKTDWLLDGRDTAPGELEYRGRRYLVSGTMLSGAEEQSGAVYGMLFLRDLTDLLQVRDEYIRSRPILAIVLIDNYDELTNNLSDAAVSSLSAALDTCVSEWADRYGGLLRRQNYNRFLLMLEAKDLVAISADRFSLLESVRSVTNPTGVAATVSIAIGKDGADYREDYAFAALAVDMALSRGGDQVVIKDRYDFTFYGGRNKQGERRTKVKSRVMASSLSELIQQSSRVFVMGHHMADLDAVGAAAGVCCLCRAKEKKVNIVIDPEVNAAGPLLKLLRTMPEYRECFLSGQDALLLADTKSLLVVVDTNRPDQVECKPLLESLRRVVVIDHHRRAADYIEQPVLNLHEPFASSASELVTEVLQYALDASDITANEAAALLSGIVLDTKNFGVRTSSRTFEAAAFLRRIGADPVMVKKLFQNDLPSTLERYRAVQAAKLYRDNLAIAALDYTINRTIAAQAADELLNISGIDTSFVLYPQGDQTIVSARSIGEANVQVILEPLGGGGNASTAGAQIKNKSVKDTLDALLRSINNYFDN